MNRKKLLSTLSVASAVLATALLAQEAKADEVVSSPDSQVSETSGQTVVQPVTAEQVASAKTSYDIAQTVQNTAQSQVDAKAQALETAKAETTNTQTALNQAQTIASEATPEAIQNAQEAVPTVERKVLPAQEAVTTAQTNLAEKEATQATAEKAMSEAQIKRDQAQADVEAKTTNVADKSKAVQESQTAVDDARTKVTEAETAQATAQNKVTDAETALEKAKKSDAGLETQTNSAKTAVDQANQEVETSNAKVETAQAEADKAATEVAKYNQKYFGADKIIATPEWLAGMKKILNFISQPNRPANYNEKLQELIQETGKHDDASVKATLKYLNEVYKDTPYREGKWVTENGVTTVYTGSGKVWDESKHVGTLDLANLPQDVLVEMNERIATLINSLRTQLGLEPAYVNLNSVDFAKKVAAVYMRDNYEDGGHYGKGINEVAESLGLRRSNRLGVDTGTQYYENLSHNLLSSKLVTKDELFAIVDDEIYGFFFEAGQDYGHALSLLTMPTFGADYSFYGDYFEDGGSWKYLKLHILTVYKNLIQAVHGSTQEERDAYYETTYGVNSTETLKLQDTAQLKAQAEEANRKAQATLAQAKTDANNAQTRYNQAKSAYDTLLATSRQTATAYTTLTDAQAELASAQTDLESARNILASATATHQANVDTLTQAQGAHTPAVQAFTDAQATLDVATASLSQAQADTASAQAILTTAQKALVDAEQAVVDAKARVEALTSAKANLDQAQASYDQAVQAQAKAQTAYDQAVAVLTNAQAETASAQATYDSLKATYDAQVAYEEAQRQAREQAEREAKAKQEQEVKAKQEQEAKAQQEQAKKNTANQVSVDSRIKGGQTATTPATVANYSSVVTATAQVTQAVLARRQAPSYQASLPETGDDNVAVYSLVGIGLLGLAGVAGRKRRHQ